MSQPNQFPDQQPIIPLADGTENWQPGSVMDDPNWRPPHNPLGDSGEVPALQNLRELFSPDAELKGLSALTATAAEPAQTEASMSAPTQEMPVVGPVNTSETPVTPLVSPASSGLAAQRAAAHGLTMPQQQPTASASAPVTGIKPAPRFVAGRDLRMAELGARAQTLAKMYYLGIRPFNAFQPVVPKAEIERPVTYLVDHLVGETVLRAPGPDDEVPQELVDHVYRVEHGSSAQRPAPRALPAARALLALESRAAGRSA